MKTLRRRSFAVVLTAALFVGLCGCGKHEQGLPVLKVAISPYQDMAMLMNAKPLGLDKKYGIQLELPSMDWQDLTPAVASATPSVDIAFASLIQFVSQEHSLNSGASD